MRKNIVKSFLYWVSFMLWSIFVVYWAYQATTYLAWDNTLTAQSWDKLTLAKWNELVSRVRWIFTDSSGNVSIGTISPIKIMANGSVSIWTTTYAQPLNIKWDWNNDTIRLETSSGNYCILRMSNTTWCPNGWVLLGTNANRAICLVCN